MPALDMDVKVRVEDDSEEEKITAGSIVTITTTLTRRTIGDIIDAAERGEVRMTSSFDFRLMYPYFRSILTYFRF